MPAPAARNDGMGSYLYSDNTCRFRIWAPFAQRVQLIGDFTQWHSHPVDLALEGNGNWSADVPGVQPLQLYKYLIHNQGGPGNDDAAVWERADARALQVEHSGATAASSGKQKQRSMQGGAVWRNSERSRSCSSLSHKDTVGWRLHEVRIFIVMN